MSRSTIWHDKVVILCKGNQLQKLHYFELDATFIKTRYSKPISYMKFWNFVCTIVQSHQLL